MSAQPTDQRKQQCRVVLISPYDLGRQPFSLAHASAVLERDDVAVDCLDLSLQTFTPELIAAADIIAINIPMFTAMRLATELLPRIRAAAPDAHVIGFGWYAHVNAGHLHSLGVNTVLGGEFESELLRIVMQDASSRAVTEFIDAPAKVVYRTPKRQHLQPLERYAQLQLADGTRRTVGFTETTRGCKYQCRHCPVVPVYHGRFRAIPADVVLADIDQQVAAGAQHISFGDPDFLNGVTHALRILKRMHARHPRLTFDATIKIEHLVDYAARLCELKHYGCLFVTTAVESVNDDVLENLDKGHTRADFERAVDLLRNAGIAMAPTFVAFTPWTTLDEYIALLQAVHDIDLVAQVAPVQFSIRLLVPRGSYLFKLPGFERRVDAFDPHLLGYPWRNDDPRVDQLQRDVQSFVEAAERDGESRAAVFEGIWERAHRARGDKAPRLPVRLASAPPPTLTEQWYCCAEPTPMQLNRARECG